MVAVKRRKRRLDGASVRGVLLRPCAYQQSWRDGRKGGAREILGWGSAGPSPAALTCRAQAGGAAWRTLCVLAPGSGPNPTCLALQLRQS
ncbi:unnamed protein product [Arctogadus glacialis]